MITVIKDIPKKLGELDRDKIFFQTLWNFAIGKGEVPKVLTCAI